MKGTATVDAPVAEPNPPRIEAGRSRRLDVAALSVAITSVVGVSLLRVITLGFLPVAPDDASYIGVGRAIWYFREPLAMNGSLYTIRSWAYPLLVGGASRLVGGDPFTGPRLLGWTLATAALALAVVFAFRLARGLGAVATAVAILAAPVLWKSVPTTRVEVALICSTMVLLLVMDSPTPRRMLVGGIVAGVTLLIKETSAPLVFLPLAYLGTVPRAEWRRLATRYVLGFAVTVGWWFITVLVAAGEIFPLAGFRQASGRQIPRGWDLNSSAQLLIVACLAGWLVVAIGRRRDARARLLVLAGLAFVPAAIIAWEKGFALRQFVPLALLSCIALGVGAADVLAGVVRRAPRGATRLAVALCIVVGLVALVPVVLAQDRTPVPAADGDLDAALARWLTARPGEPAVLSTFRFEAQLWARLEGDATLRGLPFETLQRPPPLRSAIWVDASGRDHRARVMPRENMARRLPEADYLVLTGPHRYGPIGLATWLEQHGAKVGIIPVARFGPASGSSWAYVYRLQRPRVDAIPTIVTSSAVEQMVAHGGFKPAGPTVVAGTQDWLTQFAKVHPPVDYEPLPVLGRRPQALRAS